MKIKTKTMPYKQVMAIKKRKHRYPKKPNILFKTILKIVSMPDLIATRFTYTKIGMEKLHKKEPCLILMNHSSFIDLKIVSNVLYPRDYNIVCTSDGFIGKNWLMRQLGCIPTQKFITDTNLVKDVLYAVQKLKSSVLIYPEASYSFDGTATPLPSSLGKLVKKLNIPVVMIKTFGAFSRDPLYNELKLRKVKVSAEVKYLLSQQEICDKSSDEINEMLKTEFSFDNFKWQQENKVEINENFRADGLNKVLYKCPSCLTEGSMKGEGTELVCCKCGEKHVLNKYGWLEGKGRFNHVPDWYQWQRECVRDELISGTYNLDIPVDIAVMVNTDCIYKVGSGNLKHTEKGFHLTGCDGHLDYTQKPQSSYSLYSDYFWYEIGDVICIGNSNVLYYCFPKNCGDVVAKTRLATEELYKIVTRKEKAVSN